MPTQVCFHVEVIQRTIKLPHQQQPQRPVKSPKWNPAFARMTFTEQISFVSFVANNAFASYVRVYDNIHTQRLN